MDMLSQAMRAIAQGSLSILQLLPSAANRLRSILHQSLLALDPMPRLTLLLKTWKWITATAYRTASKSLSALIPTTTSKVLSTTLLCHPDISHTLSLQLESPELMETVLSPSEKTALSIVYQGVRNGTTAFGIGVLLESISHAMRRAMAAAYWRGRPTSSDSEEQHMSRSTMFALFLSYPIVRLFGLSHSTAAGVTFSCLLRLMPEDYRVWYTLIRIATAGTYLATIAAQLLE
uniref:Uncharacterized protein n=1 Tax=Beihai noda-like virus 25 TaxID=1922479 RepID=A0A1L3KFM6_9VIRU|nr:hypothetical protein 1 [Beihai noda-like virus 25]